MPVPSDPLETVYATDEDVAVRATGDFAVLTPDWQKLAAGTDGVFASGSRWTLTSASVDFAAAGISVGHVVSLRKGAVEGQARPLFAGEGELLAVESATGGSIVLRRIGRTAGFGQPPGPAAGATSVEFVIATLAPQIEEASFALNQKYGIGGGCFGRTVDDLRDIRDLRAACVMRVLYDRYCSENRGERGDFVLKIRQYREDLADLEGRLTLRWAPPAPCEPTLSVFSTRVSR